MMNSRLQKSNQGELFGELTHKTQEDLVHFLRTKHVFDRKGLQRVIFRLKSPGSWIVVEPEHGIMTQTTSDSGLFRRNIEHGKVFTFRGYDILIVRPKPTEEGETMFSEGILSMLRTTVNLTTFTLKSVYGMMSDAKSIGWLLNVVTILVDLRDPYCYGITRLFTTLVRIISVVIQMAGSFKDYMSQALSVTDIVLMMSIAGLPSKLVSKVETFSKLTGKKFSDSGFLMSVISEFLDIVLSLLEWAAAKDPTEYSAYFVQKLRDQLSFVSTYKYVKEMTEVVTTYHRNQQIILDVQYRMRAQDVSEKIKSHPPTYSFCRDMANKATFLLYQDFTSIMVLVKNYSVSSRVEPVCIVFEGPAGAGKSTFMNKIVAALKHDNRSVYCHTVPDVNSGKDFYDDYMNQDVFVMDDVGQQGKSQWRSIINFVSPVKYPLECAQADKKNTKFFSSPLILCTTNNFTNLQGFTAKDCIAEPEALFRRAHVLKFTRAGGDIQYAKYDYQVNHSWMNMKIAPWNNCKFPDVFSGNEKNKLRGVYSAIQELLEKQKEMESTNEVPADDLDFITGKDVYEDENFEDAEIGEFQSETLTRMSSPAVSEAFRIIVSKLKGSTISLPNDSAKIKVEDMHVGILKRLLATRFQDENITTNSFELYTEDGYQLHHARRLSYYFKNDEVVRIFYSDKDVKPTVAQRVYGMVKSGSSAVMEVIGGATEKAESIKNKIVDDPKITLGLAAITAAVSLVFYHLFSTTGNIQTDDDDAGNSEVISDWKKLGPEGHKLFSESGVVATEDETNNTRRYFRFFEIFYYHEGIMKTEYCQGAVSGKYALLPLHALGDDITVNIFRDWDRYQAKHYEYNLLPCRIYKSYPHLDVAIVEFQNLPTVPFKNANMIFKRGVIKEFSSELYFCNAFHRIRSIYGTNIRMNKDPFRVVNYRKEIAFGQDAGLTYEISALGLCGSLIIDRLNGFVGMHVAGNGKDGFAVVPTSDIRNEIANIMLSSADPNYEHREELNRVNFSGSRLQYDQAQLSMAMQNTGFKPTMLNAEVDDAVKESCLKYGVAAKAPANIHKYGNPSTTLKVCAAKSFAPMKPINKEEIAFARKCLRTFMCEFTDLTDEETAFGDKRNITSLNKDAANGYGYKPTKAAYFDYENKTISPEFSQALRDFEARCKNGTTRWEDFVAKEALKAEIRPIGKDPRTFRVMPLHHIFLVKKYLGKLFSHVRDEMWSNGIAIGMNPYKDWGKLYDKIKDNYGVFALDFGKWDGSCHSMIQDMVSEVVLEFYKGEFRYVLEPLLHSMVRGFTLVNDELLCTTHSLPSGAWVTAFFNSLINRALTAITIFREMAKDGKEAKVSDFYKCVDFVLGDDKICGTPKDMAAYFNAITLRDVAESLGMTATDCHKKPITTEFHDISEISFLKRTFQVHPVLGMVGPLSLETLLTTIQWYDSNKDYDVVMGGKSTVVQIESYLHSKEMLLLFQRLLKDHSWYKEMNERRIIAIMEESDDLFAFVREALDKKY